MEIDRRLNKVINKVFFKQEDDEVKIGNNVLLGPNILMDSLKSIELIVNIEDEFDIKIDDEDINVDIFKNISSLKKMILNKLQ